MLPGERRRVPWQALTTRCGCSSSAPATRASQMAEGWAGALRAQFIDRTRRARRNTTEPPGRPRDGRSGRGPCHGQDRQSRSKAWSSPKPIRPSPSTSSGEVVEVPHRFRRFAGPAGAPRTATGQRHRHGHAFAGADQELGGRTLSSLTGGAAFQSALRKRGEMRSGMRPLAAARRPFAGVRGHPHPHFRSRSAGGSTDAPFDALDRRPDRFRPLFLGIALMVDGYFVSNPDVPGNRRSPVASPLLPEVSPVQGSYAG